MQPACVDDPTRPPIRLGYYSSLLPWAAELVCEGICESLARELWPYVYRDPLLELPPKCLEFQWLLGNPKSSVILTPGL